MKTCSLCDTDLTRHYHYFTIYPENERDIACTECFNLFIRRCEFCSDYFNGDGAICPSCDYYEGE